MHADGYIARDVGVDERHAVVQRTLEVRDDRERGVLHLDDVGRVGGAIRVRGDDHGHGFAGVARLGHQGWRGPHVAGGRRHRLWQGPGTAGQGSAERGQGRTETGQNRAAA